MFTHTFKQHNSHIVATCFLSNQPELEGFLAGIGKELEINGTRKQHQDKKAHSLAPQIFWNCGDGYRLLCVTFPASLINDVFNYVINSRGVLRFNNLAQRNIGGSKPWNVGQLFRVTNKKGNLARVGHYLLFPNLPKINHPSGNKVKQIMAERDAGFTDPGECLLAKWTDGEEWLHFEFIKSNDFLQHPAWIELRNEVLSEHGVCHLCGEAIVGIANAEHIKPRKHFPKLALTKSNLKPAHANCNKEKGNDYYITH